MTAAKLLWDADAAPDVVAAFRDYMESAPDEVGGACLYFSAPAAEIVPAQLVDRLALAVVLTYAGSGPDARAALAPMLELGHQGGIVTDVSYADFQCMNEDPPGYRNYWSADHLDAFPDAAVERFCAHADQMIVPSPSALALLPQGGAMARAGADWPIPWRLAPWQVFRFALWADPADDDRATTWARRLSADLQPWTTGDIYLNFTTDETQDRLHAGLGADNLTRLAAVKAHYDPDNILRPHHNIKPA